MSHDSPKLGSGCININVSDLDRAMGFYEELGFELFLPGIPCLSPGSGDTEHGRLPKAWPQR